MANLVERDTSLALQGEVFSLYWRTAAKVLALIPTHQLLKRVFTLKGMNCFA